MSMWVLQVVVRCAGGACILLLFAGFLVVTARRPADDRDAFIRKLPPPSQPPAVREAQLHLLVRVLVRQELLRIVKIDAVIAGCSSSWGSPSPQVTTPRSEWGSLPRHLLRFH